VDCGAENGGVFLFFVRKSEKKVNILRGPFNFGKIKK
jgi:hypothetical protein